MRRFTGLAAAAALGLLALGASVAPSRADEVTIKMWTWADRSGPLRSGNIVAAGKQLNEMLAASGSATRVKVDVYEDNADGFDTDALTLLKAFAVNKGPDLYVAAHEWIGEFARNGYAMDLDKVVADNKWAFGDVVPVLWNATKYQGKIYAIPQDTEVRMIFYDKDMLRKIGKSEEFIDSLPAKVDSGEITAEDWGKLVKEVVDKGGAKLGQLHRPNVGPDYLDVLRRLRRPVAGPQDWQAASPDQADGEGARVVQLDGPQQCHAARQHGDVLGRHPERVQAGPGLRLPSRHLDDELAARRP